MLRVDAVGALAASGLKDSTVYPAFFIAPAMNPRTVHDFQPILSAISAKVAPFLRWSRAITRAFLLPSRASGAASLALAVLVALAFFGRALGHLGRGGGGFLGGGGRLRRGAVQSLDGLPDSGHGALAVRELLDRLQVAGESGDAGKAVPDLDQAVGGQLVASLASSFSVAKCSWPSGICSAAGKAVMALSVSIAKSLMEMLLHFRKPACSGRARAGRWRCYLRRPSMTTGP